MRRWSARFSLPSSSENINSEEEAGSQRIQPRVDAPQGKGQTAEWETDFTHLSFERKMLMQHKLTNY